MIRMGSAFIFTITSEELEQLADLIHGDRAFAVARVDHQLYEVSAYNEGAALAFSECLRIVVDAECVAMHERQRARWSVSGA